MHHLELAEQFRCRFDLLRLVRAVHETLGSPLSADLRKKVESGDWVGVTNIRCDPRAYSSPGAYFRDAIAANLLRKAEDLPSGVDRESATLQKWWEAERRCYKTNRRLDTFRRGYVQYSEEDKAISRHLDGIRKIIQSWIGFHPPSSVELEFTPGSTLTDRGRQATYGHKLQNAPSSTPELDALGYPNFIGTLWHHNMVHAGMTPTMSRGGEYFTVPKTSKVNRPAELQPSLNVSIQRGYGLALMRRLRANTGLSIHSGIVTKSHGWDLRYAQEIHRKVAEKASVDRSFCTIDLSSASDTVARTLVEVLLPPPWFRLLDGLRTHYIRGVFPDFPDKWYLMEKFSSMGNGFTFELETIIFAAIACYVSRRNGYWGELGFDVFVFGDDIIVRDELYSDMNAVLEFLGFSFNREKSFHGSDPFRESCGADYFLGRNVRYASIEKTQDLTVPEAVSIANQIRRLSDRFSEYSLEGFIRPWFVVLDAIPKGWRKLRGPERFGDNVIYDPDEGSWITRNVRGNQEIKIMHSDVQNSYIPWRRFDNPTQLACAVLMKGDGRLGLLPRDPEPIMRTHWAVLQSTHGA